MSKTADSQKQSIETGLFEIIQKLSEELHGKPVHNLNPGSDLIKDAGIDSLGRIELLLRIDRHFGLTLPEEDAVNAATIQDLINAVNRSIKEQGMPEIKPEGSVKEISERSKLQSPENAQTLADVLIWYAEKFPETEYIRYLPAGDGEGEPLSYAKLYHESSRIAAGLIEGGYAPGRCTAIMLPTGFDYLFSFFGSILAGNIPVPIYPPQNKKHIEEHLRRQISILKNSESAVLITVPEALELRFLLKSALIHLKDVIIPEDLKHAGNKTIIPSPDDTAFLQYTSGTTGLPKGVILSHRNLLHNIRSMGRAIQIQEEDRFVSWLPLYHDMGLIGAVFGSLYHGIPLILMSPLSFIAKPRRWLNAIDRYRGTISAAPNFAYELCANSIPDEVIKKINLSSWRLAFNGAEPISPGTLNKFIEKFSKSGFQKTSFYPVYGLAENSVGLSFPPPGRGPLLDSVNREIFTNEGRAVPSKNSDNDLVFVCCGSPIPENKIRIVKENDEEAPERILGSIQFQSPSSTAGYYKNADATKTLFSGEWLNTGDTGYMADGELYITGRQKEIIIRGGRNIYPYELEDAIGEIPGIRPGGVAVFSLQSGGIEKMIVVAESREQKTSEKESLKQKITDLCINLHQFAPDDIVIAPIRTVLRTSSGKIRRGSIKKLYETGSIGKTPSVKMQMIRLELYSLPGRAARILKKTASLAYGLYFWTTAAFLLPAAFLSVLLVPGVKHRFVALRMIFKVFLVTVNLSVKTQGKENLESDSSVIYVSNHTSYLDAMLIISAMPFPVKFIAKAEFKKHIFSKFILSRLNVLFVERFDARGGIEDARTLTGEVRHSHPLFFFAEGTFTKQAGLRNFRMGAFAAAVQNQAGIIPVSIQGARNALRDESFLPEHSKIKISFGEIIRTDREGWDAAIELRDRTRKIILKHCGETDLRTLN